MAQRALKCCTDQYSYHNGVGVMLGQSEDTLREVVAVEGDKRDLRDVVLDPCDLQTRSGDVDGDSDGVAHRDLMLFERVIVGVLDIRQQDGQLLLGDGEGNANAQI